MTTRTTKSDPATALLPARCPSSETMMMLTLIMMMQLMKMPISNDDDEDVYDSYCVVADVHEHDDDGVDEDDDNDDKDADGKGNGSDDDDDADKPLAPSRFRARQSTRKNARECWHDDTFRGSWDPARHSKVGRLRNQNRRMRTSTSTNTCSNTGTSAGSAGVVGARSRRQLAGH